MQNHKIELRVEKMMCPKQAQLFTCRKSLDDILLGETWCFQNMDISQRNKRAIYIYHTGIK